MRTRAALTAAALVVILCVGVAAGLDEPCTPGEVKTKDCNTCRCSGTGIWGCTRMACPQPEDEGVKVAVKRNAQNCVPNTTFKLDCNTCTCNSAGTGALCTLKGCPKRSRRAIACTPGSVFKRGCNLCQCMLDGRSTVCTHIDCPREN
ncbi:protease inhibitors-like [Schistocerca gregaria]|uniref:protease inhibitors-like n=1 Tax=Schistocerca gregaria TaxID=7010 RepID=UPI00211DBFF5|nr:protease inhibitors-like [Schistocerca gregaria]